jgi:hypothetical protein
VTRAKYCISLRSPVQGMVPLRPMPMVRVAATMRVSSGCMAIFVVFFIFGDWVMVKMRGLLVDGSGWRFYNTARFGLLHRLNRHAFI